MATIDKKIGLVIGPQGPQGPQGNTGPQGATGATGATPNLTIGTVTTLEPDASATASIAGTAEDPVLNLGIPRGQTGEVTEEEFTQLKEDLTDIGYLDKTSTVTWAQGTISSAGVESDNENRIRSNNINTDTFAYATCDDNHKMWLFQFGSAGVIASSTSGTVRKITKGDLQSGAVYIRIVIVNNNANTAILPTAETGFALKCYKLNIIQNEIITVAKSNLSAFDDGVLKLDPKNFENGSISNTTGKLEKGIKYRVSYSDLQYADRNLKVYVASGYRLLPVYYQANGTFILAGEWIGSGRNFHIEKGKYYKITIAKVTDDTSEVADVADYVSKITFRTITFDRLKYFGKKNPSTLAIAHQGYSINFRSTGDCRITSIIGAYAHGFDGAEVDLKWTSDGVPVCSHESTFNDYETGDSVSIPDSTLAELKTHSYYGEPIATFEEVVAECKRYGILCVIDKIFANFTLDQWNAIFAPISKYHMQEYCWFEASDQTRIDKILEYYDGATLVVDASDTALTTELPLINANLNGKNKFVINVSTSNFAVQDIIDTNNLIAGKDIIMQVWQPDDMTTYKAYMPYAGSLLSSYFTPLDVLLCDIENDISVL